MSYKIYYMVSININRLNCIANVAWVLNATKLWFDWLGFIVPLENFSLIWRRHHYRLTVAKFELWSALWTKSSESSLACHTYFDMGAFVNNGHLRGSVALVLPSVWQWSCKYLFLRLRSVANGIRTSNLPLAGRTLKPTAPAARPMQRRIRGMSSFFYRLRGVGIYDNIIYY